MAAILILTWLYAARLALFIILLTLKFYVIGLLQTSQTYRLLVTLSSTFFVFTNLSPRRVATDPRPPRRPRLHDRKAIPQQGPKRAGDLPLPRDPTEHRPRTTSISGRFERRHPPPRARPGTLRGGGREAFTIIQANVQHSSPTHDTLLHLANDAQADIILVQEPWAYSTGDRNMHKGHPSYQCFAPRGDWTTNPPGS